MADYPLPNYPQPFGSRNIDIIKHAGPAPGAYVAGGETFEPVHLGWTAFDFVDMANGGVTFNATTAGTYYVKVIYPIGIGLPAGGPPPGTVKLQWFTAAGVEVVNQDLSAEYIMLLALGG